MNKKKIYLIIGAIFLLILGFGLSYAWFTWQSEETSVVITVDGVPIDYNAGENITGKLLPTSTKEEGISKDITVKLTNDDYESYITYYLKINELPDELKHASFKYEMYKNNVLNKSGNFENVSINDVIPISQSNELSIIEDTYTLYLWIDGNMENPIEMTDKTFSFTLYAKSSDVYTDTGGIMDTPEGCEKTYGIEKVNGVNQLVESVHCPATASNEDTSGANAPDLFEGLIPVKWNEEDVVVKADVANTAENPWYRYSHKMWANAVMVTSGTRDTYMNAEVGTTINTSDILAYWVWIPRYRYELFNATFASGTSPQTINIVFESASTTKSTGTTNGTYLTHPAFTFGSAELNGFWVAKFESSSDVSCTVTINATLGTGCNKTDLNPRILPGVTSWRGAQISTQYAVSQKFMNIAYLTSNGVSQVDAHMLKNTEWGAVAYLSHSQYGKNAEITKNDYSDYYTGGGTGTAYITNVGQSTTGNVYGIYDMSGGTNEHVMGNLNNTTGQSGLTVTSINGKYVDIYAGTTIANSKLGDAVGETAGWYGDLANFVTSSQPWFIRSGTYFDDTIVGAFCFTMRYGGNFYDHDTFRSVLSAK